MRSEPERERRERKRRLRRRRAAALGIAGLVCAAVAALVVLVLAPSSKRSDQKAGGKSRQSGQTSRSSTTGTQHAAAPGPPYAVGVRTVALVDTTRSVTYANGTTGPRVLNTEIRYPARGQPGGRAVPDARPQLASGPFPLIVFGHGYALLPVEYHRLLNAWASAGYVVAAPIFPAENKDAPGGPDENDLPNQPGDMKFVISQMQAADHDPSGPLSGLIMTGEVAVAGHSDGGDTALAVAYDEYEGLRDPTVKAAVILSGAEMRALPSISFPAASPPLLATQGTADTINRPAETSEYFDAARPPRYLLQLFGAEHYAPYISQEPQLRIVEQVSIDFLNRYLKRRSGSLAAMSAAGNVQGIASLQADR